MKTYEFKASRHENVAECLELQSAPGPGMPNPPEKYLFPGVKKSKLKNLITAPIFLEILDRNFRGVFDYKPNAGRLEGELKHLIDAGYPAFGLWGFLNAFHTRSDTPATTST